MLNKVLVTSKDFEKHINFDGRDFLLKLHDAGDVIEHQSGVLYVFLQRGESSIRTKSLDATLKEGMYFALSEAGTIRLSRNSRAISIFVKDFNSMNSIGGPIEATGRLRYIDGCSDTLLLPPCKLGEPCLNHLHFPSQTKQTSHHHPSFRFGIVFSGEGCCVSESHEEVLSSGDVFFIPEGVKHNFNTSKACMDVIAFHPDSDWGPTDEAHPMINKTLI